MIAIIMKSYHIIISYYMVYKSMFISRKSDKKKAKELLAAEQAVIDSELWEARYEALTETKNDFR